MEKVGFVKLHRKIMDWEWYDSYPEFKLFIHLLLKVNHDDVDWRGEKIKRGSCITSLGSLSAETGLSIQQIRTALKHLKSTHEITSIGRNKNTLVIVLNYDLYQEGNTIINNQVTINQQSTNNQLTTNKNDKNEKNEKNIYGAYRHVRLSFNEIEKLKAEFPDYKKKIQNLDDYIEMTGKTYKNHYLTIKIWEARDQVKRRKQDKPLPDWYYDQGEETSEVVSDEEIKKLLSEIACKEESN